MSTQLNKMYDMFKPRQTHRFSFNSAGYLTQKSASETKKHTVFQYHPKIHKHETVFISSATETRHCCWTLQAFSPRETFLSAVQTQISPATVGVIIIKCLDERLGIKNVSDLNADIHVTSVIYWLSHSHRHSVQILSNLMTFPSAVAQREDIKMINLLYIA